MPEKEMKLKERKHALLWQAYKTWDELKEMRKKHILRLSAIERGVAGYDSGYEEEIIANLTVYLKDAKKEMHTYGKGAGPIWDKLLSIRGIADHTAAKLIALFDDVGKFDTISKFWRFAGYGLYEYWVNENGTVMAPKDGKREADGEHAVAEPKEGWTLKRMIDRPVSGWMRPYDARLKSECYLVSSQFVSQRTPVYRELYEEYKARQRAEHPRIICKRCGTKFLPSEGPGCPGCGQTNARYQLKFCDAHLDMRARRYVSKIFLGDFWLEWREIEGLPVSDPYIIAKDNEHSHKINGFI